MHHLYQGLAGIEVLHHLAAHGAGFHLRQVGTLPCLICKQLPSHPHHLTFAQPRGLALKVSDEFVVPLCAEHHNDLHRTGTERLWWTRVAIDPMPIAKQLWRTRMATI